MTEQKKNAAWTIIGIFITGIFIALGLKYLGSLEHLLKSSGLLGPILSIALYAIFSVTPVPTDSLTLINGAIFGPVIGTILATLGNTLAALLEYFIGNKVRTLTGTKGKTFIIPVIKKEFPVNSVPFLLWGRFIPGYGGKLVSIMGGMYKVPIWKYIWTALVANTMGALMFAYGGHLIRALLLKF